MDNPTSFQQKIQAEARKIRIEPSERVWQQLRKQHRQRRIRPQRIWYVAAVGLICILSSLFLWNNAQSPDLDQLDFSSNTSKFISADQVRFIHAAYASHELIAPKNRSFKSLRVKDIGGSL